MITVKKFLYCCALSTCFMLPAWADEAGDTLTKLLLAISTMQADFSQSIRDKSTQSLSQSEGQMSLSRPGKFRWETRKPSAQVIIANGSRLWIYDVDLEQVTIRTLQKAAGQTPALLLSDKNLTLSRDYNVKQLPSTSQIAGTQTFQLISKQKDDAFASVQLTFVNQQLHEMRLADRLGHVTTITFRHVKTGLALADSLFTFKPSANIDVIDETRNRH